MEHVIIQKPHHTHQSSKRAMIAYGTFFAFFLFGWIGNMAGAAIPTILQELRLTYSQVGTMFFGVSLGVFLATLLIGPLADIIGKKAVVFTSCGCFAAGIIGFSSFNIFGVLTARSYRTGSWDP